MQKHKREISYTSKASVGIGGARNAQIIKTVENHPFLHTFCEQLAELTRIGKVILQIQNKGVVIKFYSKKGIINSRQPSLEEATADILQKLEAKSISV